jgi:nucleotide-binding universal stress UspA family protein
MRSILVPTDFSTASSNAVVYGAEMACATGATLLLLHICQQPYFAVEQAMLMPDPGVAERDGLELLNEVKCRMVSRFGNNIKIDCHCHTGINVDESINEFALEEEVDLVITAIHGAGYLEEKFIGSTVTKLIKNSKLPVLVINGRARFRPLKKIVLASDYKELPNLSPFKDILKLYKSSIQVLHVITENEDQNSGLEIRAGIRSMLADIEHEFHEVKNKDIIEGINDFVKSAEADMVILAPHAYKFPANIFHKHNTRRMAFHAEVPMLAVQP